MSCILGITAFHPDTSACLVIDGKLKAAVSEERLGKRIKHDPSFPFLAIESVLKMAGIEFSDVTHIALARDSRANLGAKIRHALSHPSVLWPAVNIFRKRHRKTTSIPELICGHFNRPYNPKRLAFVGVEHHLAHIASAYYLSPFESLTAGFSYDGSGDFASLMAARCEGNSIEIIDKVLMPDSLGIFYTALCQFIGFDGFGEEYKVMGLAPYGENRYAREMAQLLPLDADGWFHLAKGCFGSYEGLESGMLDERGHIRMGRQYSDILINMFGRPRGREEEISQRDQDIAKSCQMRFEAAAIHCLRRLNRLVPTRQLAMAGGCALNGVANAAILRDTPFERPYLQAASSDEGTSLGAAYWCYHNVTGGTERFHMRHAFWGPEYSDAEIQKALERAGRDYKQLPDHDLFTEITKLLRRGAVVGWYQGRSEWGPRALGNRSILADPTNPDMKSIINAKIKRRESFRPFAPSVLAEKVGEYFEQDIASPFMMHVVKFKPDWREKLPAVTHVDGTGRLQSVSREENPRYYELIRRFSEVSGVAMLLNTSFNENEPVVDNPDQALDCFTRTGMDALCLGNFLVEKAR
ncbi:MAG: hypothetical protein LBU39_01705 [Desulfobulbaceae bacterium]|jgi:carbamoyltransferase|nr:hypothetical protein [Desulfobulbaceae bacterium]